MNTQSDTGKQIQRLRIATAINTILIFILELSIITHVLW